MKVASAAPLMRPVLAACTFVALAGCTPIYGASFDFPPAPAVPSTATVLVNDEGWDDDDPIRLRARVIDVGNSSSATVLDLYRATYRSADGWTQLAADPQYQELCLVRHSDKGYSEFVEVFPYEGSRVTANRSRHLVLISRLQDVEAGRDEDSCGHARAWIPSDLF